MRLQVPYNAHAWQHMMSVCSNALHALQLVIQPGTPVQRLQRASRQRAGKCAPMPLAYANLQQS